MRAVHVGFDLAGRDPAKSSSCSTFLALAPDALWLDELSVAFDLALLMEGAAGHGCFARDVDGSLLRLTGDVPAPSQAPADPSLSIFDVETLSGEPLIVAIASEAAPDRGKRARLHALAVAFATQAAILIEAGDEAASSDAITPTERQCLALRAEGRSSIDIGECLDLSPFAVGVHLRRAEARMADRPRSD